MLPKLIVVAGTTASGKSDLGVALAKRYGGEIVSADSRQVYRGLTIGSGKITPEEMQGVAHHLLDVCDPNAFFSMGEFQRRAYIAIDDIIARGKLPFLVGGTGLYVNAVADGYVFSHIEPDLRYRAELETHTTEELYQMLLALRPEVQVDGCNRNRVMRLLEKLHDGDDVEPRKEPRYDTLRLGVTWEREVLRERIDERLRRRMEGGMADEMRGLLDAGVDASFLLKLGLEYRYVTQYVLGELADEEEMFTLLSTAIKQFAKRQMTWFRRDEHIHWLSMTDDPITEACRLIDQFLA